MPKIKRIYQHPFFIPAKPDYLSHDQLHIAIMDNNIDRVTTLLLHKQIKPCYSNPIENCFNLAQGRRNSSEILKVLLKKCSAGVNAIYCNGDTLLIKDIRNEGFKNFKLLTETIELDVNRQNFAGFSALHYAALKSNTPVEYIRKLIELKADVNMKITNFKMSSTDNRVINELIEATPIICLLKFYDKNNGGFEKLQLLVNNGAKVNTRTALGRTPLMYAASVDVNLSSDLELINYMFEKGALAGVYSNINENALAFLISTLHSIDFSPQDTEKLTNDYYIKIIELLIENGDDPFVGANRGGVRSLLYGILNAHQKNLKFRELILYLIRKQFSIIIDRGITRLDFNQMQIYPLEPILKSFDSFLTDGTLLNELIKLIIHSPIRDFKTFTPTTFNSKIKVTDKMHLNLPRLLVFYTDVKYYNVTSIIVKHLPLYIMENTLEDLHKNNFHFNGDELCILLARIVVANKEITADSLHYLIRIFHYIIRNPNKYPKNFDRNILQMPSMFTNVRRALNVPDCAWLAVLTGNTRILEQFLPYCNATHPICILFLMQPYHESIVLEPILLQIIQRILDTLIAAKPELPNSHHFIMEMYMARLNTQFAIYLHRPKHIKKAYIEIYNKILKFSQQGYRYIPGSSN